MKVILTGGTGNIGSGVLSQALIHPSITEIIALSRSPITLQHSKLKVIIVKDFTQYDDSVLKSCQGAIGCMW